MNAPREKSLGRLVRDRVKNAFTRVSKRPVIVLGHQKSGTSAVAHLLADAVGLSKTVDIPALWLSSSARILRGEERFARAVRRNRAAFATGLIKEPYLTFYADQVVERFPEGRFVFVLRDPRDNIRSFLNRRKIPGDLEGFDETELPEPLRGILFNPELWGGEGENYVGVMAHRWNRALGAYLAFRQRMTLARYEDFVRDKVGFIQRLARSLGLSPAHDISSRVDIPFQPPGDRDAKWLDFFGEANLKRIETICAAGMDEFGYAR